MLINFSHAIILFLVLSHVYPKLLYVAPRFRHHHLLLTCTERPSVYFQELLHLIFFLLVRYLSNGWQLTKFQLVELELHGGICSLLICRLCQIFQSFGFCLWQMEPPCAKFWHM